MNVERVRLDTLVADPQNPRRHDERNMAAIVDSLRLHGQVEPLVVQKSSRMVIAGNGRAAALRTLGETHANVVLLDVSDDEARALSIRLNRTGDLASWNDDVLAKHLRELDTLDDASDFGFDDSELASLVSALDAAYDDASESLSGVQQTFLGMADDSTSDDEFDVDEAAVEATTQRGDVVSIGEHALHCGDCLDVLRSLDENSVDAIVCDPPYGIGYMAKQWDASVPGEAWARECLRVLKPGGHLIAFAATRTLHRLAVAVEDAGFELRDTIAWLYWTGFPKSVDVEREVAKRDTSSAARWSGFGTGIKPAHEPAVLARKPLDGTIAQNVARWGVGVLNVDDCRFGVNDTAWPGPTDRRDSTSRGRFPANVYHCAKPSRRERETGCEHLPTRTGAEAVERAAGSAGMNSPRAGAGRTAANVRNWHPTVKPLRLMRWLVRLVGCQRGSVVLDTFAGSGTTLVAAHVEGFRSIGIELDERHCDIARARLEHAVRTHTKETP